MKKIFMLPIIIFVLSQLSCNTTEPTDNLKPGRRDYVWTVDTIPVSNSVMKDMWGSSPTDIWICGDGFDRRQSLWHYDGTIFTPYNEYILSATSFCGFAQNNIWMATSTGWIWHYDGVSWKKDTTLSLSGYNDVVIVSLYGTAPNNLYAIGMAVSLDDYRGVIANYNGKNWSYITIPYIRVNFYDIKYDNDLNTFLISGANFDNIGKDESLYTLKNNILTEIYAGTSGRYLGVIEEKVYIYNDKIIYKYNGTSLERFLDLSSTNYLGRVSGRSEKDFFCNTVDYENDLYGIGHWNGTDLATLYPTKFLTSRDLLFNDEVMFLGGWYVNEDINVVIKGKLNNN